MRGLGENQRPDASITPGDSLDPPSGEVVLPPPVQEFRTDFENDLCLKFYKQFEGQLIANLVELGSLSFKAWSDDVVSAAANLVTRRNPTIVRTPAPTQAAPGSAARGTGGEAGGRVTAAAEIDPLHIGYDVRDFGRLHSFAARRGGKLVADITGRGKMRDVAEAMREILAMATATSFHVVNGTIEVPHVHHASAMLDLASVRRMLCDADLSYRTRIERIVVILNGLLGDEWYVHEPATPVTGNEPVMSRSSLAEATQAIAILHELGGMWNGAERGWTFGIDGDSMMQAAERGLRLVPR